MITRKPCLYIIGDLTKKRGQKTQQLEREALASGIDVRRVAEYPKYIESERCIFVDDGEYIRPELLKLGLQYLDRFDVLAPSNQWGRILQDYGGPADIKQTLDLVGDLRVVPYYPQMFFAKNSAAGKKFYEAFLNEKGDMVHRFYRAMYRSKIKIYMLPVDWSQSLKNKSISFLNSRDKSTKRGTTQNRQDGFVRIDLGNGRFAKCRPQDVAKIKKQRGLV